LEHTYIHTYIQLLYYSIYLFRYQDHLPEALKGVTLQTKASEKVGIGKKNQDGAGGSDGN